jgi:glycosyltransferase involved in cell wall biosynthesis
MHILFVTAEYPPMPGGVGAYTAELGRALSEQGCQVSILTSQTVDVVAATPTIPVYAKMTHWDWRIWGAVGGWARQLAVDWVHVQYQTGAFAMHPAINFAPWWWRRAWRGRQPTIRVAWTYHDLLAPYLFPKAGAGLRGWVTQQPARTSDLVIVTNSEDYARLAGKTPVLAHIPIGSNIAGKPFSLVEHQRRRQQRGYGDDQLLVGYFGFLNHSKGGLTLVHTLAQLMQGGRDAHLLMIGERVGANDPTNARYLQEVEKLIDQMGLTTRIQWTGHQAESEVSADLAACDVLLMPYEDGASLRRGTLLAGLAHGCAVVTTTPQAPLPELVDGRDLLYVAPGDAVAAAQAVRRIADDADLAARLRTHAYIQSQLFSWTRIGEQHNRFYHSEKPVGQ